MPKITRITHTIFGGGASAAVDGIAQFGSKQAGSPNYSVNIATIQSLAAWLQGWAGAVTNGKVLPLEELNAAFLEPSYQIGYMLEMGIPEYDAGTTYFKNSICQYTGLIYQSIADNNTGNTPTTSSTTWMQMTNSLWGGTATGYTTGNPWALTISSLPASYDPVASNLPNGTFLSLITGPGIGTTTSEISINGGTAYQIVDALGQAQSGMVLPGQFLTVFWDVASTEWVIPRIIMTAPQIYPPVVDTGTANNLILAIPNWYWGTTVGASNAPQGTQIYVIPAHTNTGPTQITIYGSTFQLLNKAGSNFSGGELVDGSIYLFALDISTKFRLIA